MSISGRVEVDFGTWASVGYYKLSFGHSSRILSHCCCYENAVRHHRYKIVSQQTVTKCCYTKRSFWMRNFLRRLLGVSVVISHLEMNTREDTVTSAMTNNIFPLPIRNCCEHLCFFSVPPPLRKSGRQFASPLKKLVKFWNAINLQLSCRGCVGYTGGDWCNAI